MSSVIGNPSSQSILHWLVQDDAMDSLTDFYVSHVFLNLVISLTSSSILPCEFQNQAQNFSIDHWAVSEGRFPWSFFSVYIFALFLFQRHSKWYLYISDTFSNERLSLRD